MVHLSDVVGGIRVQVNYGGATKVVVAVDQMTRQSAMLTINQGLAELLDLRLSLHVGVVGALQPLLDLLSVNLLLEADREDGVAAAFKNLGQVGHGALNFFLEVVGTPHVAHQEVLADEPGAAKVVLDSDLFIIDLVYSQVRDAREVLTNFHLLRVPQRLADSLSGGALRARRLAANSGS